MPGQSSYLETVDFAPERTIPFVIRRRGSGQLIGTARLELPGASIVEAVVRFQPDSSLARSIARRAFAEVGGLATSLDLKWSEKLDVIDTLSAAMTQLADKFGLEHFFLFPRRTLMGLLHAAIPDILPPYHFSLVQEVLGWQEDSPRLQGVRQLHVKALPASPETLPVVYAISPNRWAADAQSRLALREKRQHTPELARQLITAMRQAQRQVDAELTTMNQRRRNVTDSSVPASPASPATAAELNGHQGFLPFPATVDFKAEYLQQVMTQGGEAVKRYKTMSYELLHLAPGMLVLDVGCGAGVDLLALAERVGQSGQVIGLDNDPDVLQVARQAIAVGPGNVLLVNSEASKLPFLDGQFDRVRADRMLQHVTHPGQVLSELWRVLRPDGILALVEPDWKAIAVHPGSQAGGDDTTLEHVLKRYQSKLPHALIGRQLYALLRQQGAAWEQIQVQAVSFTLTAWPIVDTLLQLSQSAQALAQEQPALRKEIQGWLQALDAAHQAGTFLASIPLFFVEARKTTGATRAETDPLKQKGQGEER
jgi:ubiquinone/menaquinone biosynthesis C-methylase UbiE